MLNNFTIDRDVETVRLEAYNARAGIEAPGFDQRPKPQQSKGFDEAIASPAGARLLFY
ncbi:MAG TPA: hypothetical protein IGS52_15700 [Oscillatoriaceae cyanobacterium M33_DOE_052]|nr:hypothetical protein [Oscillatoriaceae cyanobacterium M33_DOE_052]